MDAPGAEAAPLAGGAGAGGALCSDLPPRLERTDEDVPAAVEGGIDASISWNEVGGEANPLRRFCIIIMAAVGDPDLEAQGSDADANEVNPRGVRSEAEAAAAAAA